MRVCFQLPFLRLAVCASTAVLLALGITACTTSTSMPIVYSAVAGEADHAGMNMPGMSHRGYTVDAIFKSAVTAGSNEVTLQLHDVVTGEHLRNPAVRATVKKLAHSETATNNHDNAGTANHDSTESGNHNDAKADTHNASGTIASHDPASAIHAHEPLAMPAAGEYSTQLNFPDEGEWLVTVNFVAKGQPKEATFAVNAGRGIEKWAVLGGLLSLNVAIIAVAGITKRKTVKGQAGMEPVR